MKDTGGRQKRLNIREARGQLEDENTMQKMRTKRKPTGMGLNRDKCKWENK